MKINQNDSCWTCYNTKIFKTSRGFSSKLKPYNSVNLAIGRACFYEQFCSCQLYLKKPSEDQNVDHLDHLYVAILCDSYYVSPNSQTPKLPNSALLTNNAQETDDSTPQVFPSAHMHPTSNTMHQTLSFHFKLRPPYPQLQTPNSKLQTPNSEPSILSQAPNTQIPTLPTLQTPNS